MKYRTNNTSHNKNKKTLFWTASEIKNNIIELLPINFKKNSLIINAKNIQGTSNL